MPATVPTRGVLKASTNRVRTSTALQGNAMWDNVIGMTNDHAGANSGVEALINAPTIGGGRKATQARRQAAAEAVLATGGFDTSITNYQSLLAIAKQQGAVGTGARGACKVCGQTGHLTKMCRNAVAAGGYDEAGAAEGAIAGFVDAPLEKGAGIDDLDLSSDSSSDEERRRKKRRKEKKEKRRKEKERKHKKEKRRKEKKSKDKKRSSKDKKSSKKRRHSSSSSSSSSGSDSD